MKKILSIFVLFIILGLGCKKEEGLTQNQEGEIYLRIVQDLSHPPNNNAGWCNIISGCYKDNNPDIPDNAMFDQFYGPLKPGTYNASFCFDNTNPGSSNTFTYTLESPEPGKRRMYTRMVRDYNSNLNRCLDVSRDLSYMSYRDELL